MNDERRPEAAPEITGEEIGSSVLQRPRRPVYGLAKVDPIHFTMRLLQDCLNEATVAYWLRRAEQFDDCNPFLALQCRRHAAILADSQGDEISPEVLAVLAEVA